MNVFGRCKSGEPDISTKRSVASSIGKYGDRYIGYIIIAWRHTKIKQVALVHIWKRLHLSAKLSLMKVGGADINSPFNSE